MKPPALRRRITVVIIAIAIAITVAWPAAASAAVASCSGTAGSFGGGAGTSASPYLVATQAHLAAVATGNNRFCAYRQTQDIALTGEWAPLGNGALPFKGEYDGDNRAITGLNITTNGSYLGLFGYTDGGAEIKNLRLAGTVNVPSSSGVGALIGLADRPTTITNVHSSVNVTAQSLAGGLVGWVAEAIIRRSSASGSITVSGGTVGGLVGKARSSYGNLPSEISDSFATGAVTGGDSYEGVAGLVGSAEVGGGSYSVTIARSYSTGLVTGGIGSRLDCSRICQTFTGTTGGMLAREDAASAYSANVIVTGAFWDTQTSNRATSADNLGTGLTTAQAKTRSTYTAASWDIANGWSPTSVWGICDGSTYPFLNAQYASSPCRPDAPATPTAVAAASTGPSPITPTNISWSEGRVTTAPLIATFTAAPDTRYLIAAVPQSAKVARRAARAVRGTCTVTTAGQGARRTARCTIRLRTAATWRISITPVQGGVKGVAATKRVTITLPVPDRPTAPDGTAEPVTG